MDTLILIIMKLLNSCIHLIGNDVTAAKLLITEIINELMAFVVNLENVGVKVTDTTILNHSNDIDDSVLAS